MLSQAAVAELICGTAASRRFAEEQLAIWRSATQRIGDSQTALLITHGGKIELPAVLHAIGLGATVDPLPLAGVHARFHDEELAAVIRLSV